jgi:uncharacterized protein
MASLRRFSFSLPVVFTAITLLLGLILIPMAQGRAFTSDTTPVFINEFHYDNDGIDAGEFVEIAGPAGTNLSGWTLILYNGSGGAFYTKTDLSGTLPNQCSSYGTLVVNYPANGIQNGSPDGIALVNNGTVVQFLSYEGTFVAVGETANGLTSTDVGVSEPSTAPLGSSLHLVGTGSTYGDFTWAYSSGSNTAGTCNAGQTFTTSDVLPSVISTAPAANTSGVAPTSTITINFSETVDVAPGAITLVCDGTPVSYSGGSANDVTSVTLTPDAALPDGATCTVTVSAGQVTDNDGTADAMTADYVFSFAILTTQPTLIHTIQGAGAASPMDGSTVIIDGVVVGDYQGANELRGFFVQEQTSDMDADPATSEGIFVFDNLGPVAVSEGDLVRVTGTVDEFFGLTELSPVTSVVVEGSGSGSLVTPASIDLPIAPAITIDAFWEQYESMAVTFVDPMTVAEHFELGRYGHVQLVAGERPYQYTQLNAPNLAGYTAYQDSVDRRSIFLDDFNNQENRTDLIYHPQPGGFSPTNYFRSGDTISPLIGVLNYAFSAWRIEPQKTTPVTFTSTNPRPAVPDVGGTVTVASFNVLNYFNGPVFPTSRGADSPAEFATQRDKIVSAITQLDADVVGLLEIENDSGAGQAVADLVSGLNAAQPDSADDYAFIDTGVVGTDEIKVALIYRPAVVSPIGAYQILSAGVDPNFDSSRNRPALAQTFQDSAGGRFTIVVNHLKSKGSGCGPGDDDTVQGNCNGTRTRAAQALATWLASDPTNSGDPDVLIIGDLNAYAMEDPVTTLLAAGYTNVDGVNAYSYLFDGQIGTLDHALASPGLNGQVTAAAVWHINADEVPLLDYNDTIRDPSEATFEQKPYPLTASGPYRSSDHDPVLIGLNLRAVDLVLLKDDGGISTRQNERLTYTLTYRNAGNTQATGVTITETVPLNTFFDPRRSTSGWSCTPNNDAGATCTLAVGTLAAGASNTATFAVKVVDRVPREVTAISNTARIADDGSKGVEPTPQNNTATDTTPLDQRGAASGGAASGPSQLIEAESANVVRSGGWTTLSTPDGASGNAYVVSSRPQDVLVLPFSGSAVQVRYIAGPAFGRFTLVMDGSPVQSIDSNRRDFAFGQVAIIDGLTEGAHELRLLPDARQVIAIDAFTVITLGPSTTPEVPATIVSTPTIPVVTLEPTTEGTGGLDATPTGTIVVPETTPTTLPTETPIPVEPSPTPTDTMAPPTEVTETIEDVPTPQEEGAEASTDTDPIGAESTAEPAS